MAQEKTIMEFVSAHKLTMACMPVKTNPNIADMPKGSRHFLCTLIAENRMKIHYSQGPAHKINPTIEDVLDCLASDACGFDNARSFEDWASDLGYDIDSRKAERAFEAVGNQSTELKVLLGDEAFEELVYRTERL